MCMKRIFFVVAWLLCVQCLFAQPFANEIKAFKVKDSTEAPPKNAILFVGSSSFRVWSNVQEYFPGYTIINRGFGGSTFPDVIAYANDVIFPYQPKQIVVYCGDNDLASSDTITAATVASRFFTLFELIRKQLPDVNISYVSIKPSPSRQKLMGKMEEANQLIAAFLAQQKNTSFIDVYHKMLNADGLPNKNLFTSDMLHMNLRGYAIWQTAIQPYLLK